MWILYSDDMTLHSRMTVNVLKPTEGTPMAGNSNYTTGTGTDDAEALQSIIDAAVASGAVPCIEVPGRRTYRIGSTITVPAGITIRGLGGLSDVGTTTPPCFVWTGAAGGTMFDVAVASQNIPMTCFENLYITGRTDGTNLPATLIKFRGTGGNLGSPDTGTYFRNVWFQNSSDDAVRIEGGTTNFLIEGGRFDNWGGYAIYVTGSGSSITIDGNHTMAMGEAADGMIFLDGETSGAHVLKLIGLHLETNASLNETYSGGTNPFDKRGLIRLGVNASESAVQHHVTCVGLEVAEPFSISSHCVFQITASSTADSDLDNTRMVNISVIGGKGLSRGTTDANASDEIRVIGGRVHASERPPVSGSGNISMFSLSIGKNSTGEQIWSWTNSRGTYFRTPVIQAMTFSQRPTDFPKGGMIATFSDVNNSIAVGTNLSAANTGTGSNSRPAFYDGTNWKLLLAT